MQPSGSGGKPPNSMPTKLRLRPCTKPRCAPKDSAQGVDGLVCRDDHFSRSASGHRCPLGYLGHNIAERCLFGLDDGLRDEATLNTRLSAKIGAEGLWTTPCSSANEV